jgi:two-component system, sensor histidine kinase PdtaS
MSDSVSAKEALFRFPWVRAARREQAQYDALTVELQAARAREEVLLRDKFDLLQRQEMLAQEFEHRLVNSLQIIVSLLSLQSRTAGPEAAAQLTVAANRVASFGRVHRGYISSITWKAWSLSSILSTYARTFRVYFFAARPHARSSLRARQ